MAASPGDHFREEGARMTAPDVLVEGNGATDAAGSAAPFIAPTSADEVRAYVRNNSIQFLFAQFVDMHGKPNAKLVPAAHLDDLLTDGAGFAGFAAGEIGQQPNDPDMIAIPDVRSFTPLPWRPGVARFACDVTVEGQEWLYCPRTILRKQLERAAALGFEFKLGAELEYFLVRRNDDGTIELADPLDNLAQPCYDMRALTRNLDFVSSVATNVSSLGWDNYATDHEDANGQFEQNFGFDDALITCDRAVFFRYMVESLAQERGLIATFMPKPFAQLTGNGCHFHMSLWRDGANVFERSAEEDRARLGIDVLPANLLDATRELEGNDVVRAALGRARDEDYADYYIRCKRREWQSAHEQITQWEIDRYLQLF